MTDTITKFTLQGVKFFGSGFGLLGLMLSLTWRLDGWWAAGTVIASMVMGVGMWLVFMSVVVRVLQAVRLTLEGEINPDKSATNDGGVHEVKFWARGKRQKSIYVPNKPHQRGVGWGGREGE